VKRERVLKILMFLLIAAIIVLMVACSASLPSGGDYEIPTDPSELNKEQTIDDMYNALINGGKYMNDTDRYSVENVYNIFVDNTAKPKDGQLPEIINYIVTYKAVYAKNVADSIIFIEFDDKQYEVKSLTVFYDGKNLYLSTVSPLIRDDKGNVLSQYSKEENVIKDFGATMMFRAFYTLATAMDMTGTFIGGELTSLFDRRIPENIGVVAFREDFRRNKTGENGENIEVRKLDFTTLLDQVNALMENFFSVIGNKFDVITKKYLHFSLSRICEMKFATLKADLISVHIEDGAADRTVYELSGNLRDASEYKVTANVGYGKKTRVAEGDAIEKAQYRNIDAGKANFLGEILIPFFGDEPFDTSLKFDINKNNDETLGIFEVVRLWKVYFKEGSCFADASGLYDWFDGAVDLAAMNLPKVNLSNLNLNSILNSVYNDIVKIVIVLATGGKVYGIDGEGLADMDEDEALRLYELLMDNFWSDGKTNTIYYRVTEKLISEVRGEPVSFMQDLADALGVDKSQLERYLGEDFFDVSEFILSYNLDTHRIGIDMNTREELVFSVWLLPLDFVNVIIPNEVYKGSDAYADFILPDCVTLELEGELWLTGGRLTADLSKLLGSLIGDVSGLNTVFRFSNSERLFVKAKVTNNYSKANPYSHFIIELYRREVIEVIASGGGKVTTYKDTLIMAVYTNPNDYAELLVDYRLPIGSYANLTGLKFRIPRDVVRKSLEDLLGNNSVFGQDGVFVILDTLIDQMNSGSTLSKENGWFAFNLLYDGGEKDKLGNVIRPEHDPVFNIIGVKFLSATMRSRILFTQFDTSFITAGNFKLPTYTDLNDIAVASIYESGSVWTKTAAFDFFGATQIVNLTLSYKEETVKLESGKKDYRPTAEIFGYTLAYNLHIFEESGTLVVQNIVDTTVYIDPAFTKTLPEFVEVIFSNGTSGLARCTILNFSEANITTAGYNLGALSNEITESMYSTLNIGFEGSSLDFYTVRVIVVVQNREVRSPYLNDSERFETDPLGTPVIGEINVDPYTYAMTKKADENFDLILDEIIRQQMTLTFNYVYNRNFDENNELISEDYIFFYLTDLGLVWDASLVEIEWKGGVYYAYSYYGSEAGYRVKIAIRLNVMSQLVDHVKIGTNDNGKYEIDYLVWETYTIPSFTTSMFKVEIVFNRVNGKRRTVVSARPSNISDADFFNNYLVATLSWAGASDIIYKIKQATVDPLFSGGDGYTTAAQLSDFNVGVQTVALEVVVPTRKLPLGKSDTVIGMYDVSGAGLPVGIPRGVTLTRAKFPLSNGALPDTAVYAPYEINPYNTLASLPEYIWLEVSVGKEGTPAADLTTWRKYPITYETTDPQGNQLNIIKNVGGRYYLANPTTAETRLVVYGKVGNSEIPGEYIWVTLNILNQESIMRGWNYFARYDFSFVQSAGLPTSLYATSISYIDGVQTTTKIQAANIEWQSTDMGGNELGVVRYEDGAWRLRTDVDANREYIVYGKTAGGIWVILTITRDEIYFQDIRYLGLSVGDMVGEYIEIDPYKPYRLPSGFVAVLENGSEVSFVNIVWEVLWETVPYGDGDAFREVWLPTFDLNPSSTYKHLYDKSGNFVFPYNLSRPAYDGTFTLRYIIEPTAEAIKQEIYIGVKVLTRNISSGDSGTQDKVEIFNQSSRSAFKGGYHQLNPYGASGAEILARLETLLALQLKTNLTANEHALRHVGVYFTGVKVSSDDRYTLIVDWNVETNVNSLAYATSLIRLIDALKHPVKGFSMVLRGTVMTGTVNEQEILIPFGILDNELKNIALVNSAGTVKSEETVLTVNDMKSGYILSYDTLLSNGKVISMTLERPFALTIPLGSGRTYASPYQFFTYLFERIELYFTDGSENKNAVGSTSLKTMTQAQINAFNTAVLEQGGTTFVLTKLSTGSAEDNITISVTSYSDRAIDKSFNLTAELYDTDGARYGTSQGYLLPKYADVRFEGLRPTSDGMSQYVLSYVVRFDIREWTARSTTYEMLKMQTLSAIPLKYIDIIRDGKDPDYGSIFMFTYELPCDAGTFYLNITIPRMDMQGTNYDGVGASNLYTVNNGVMNIENPYLFYDPTAEGVGLDATLLPTVVYAKVTNYFDPNVFNAFYISTWEILSPLTEYHIRNGTDKDKPLLFARARIPSYYDIGDSYLENGRERAVYVYLYLNVKAMKFYSISYQTMRVERDEDTQAVTIIVDPYDDDMNYRGEFRLPQAGLTVQFWDGVSYTFTSGITYYILNTSGERMPWQTVTYNHTGHTLKGEYPKDILTIQIAIPGFSSGIDIYLHILSRIVEDLKIDNAVRDAQGNRTTVSVPWIYYIDPYDTSTFNIPTEISVRFRGYNDYSVQTSIRYELLVNNAFVGLPYGNFSSKASTAQEGVKYAYYVAAADSYKGAIYTLKGTFSLGMTTAGVSAGEQDFYITVIVLNRSLIQTYTTSKVFDDPLGGLLKDIPSNLYDDEARRMFVTYDNYYKTYVNPYYFDISEGTYVEKTVEIPPEFLFSAISVPVVPKIDWAVGRDDSVVLVMGGFTDREIDGYLYLSTQNVSYRKALIKADVEKLYNEAVKARVIDALPSANLSDKAKSILSALLKAVEDGAIFAAYKGLLVDLSVSADPKDRDYASYTANTLINETAQKHALDPNASLADLTVFLFSELRDEYDLWVSQGKNTDAKNARIIIAEKWLVKYSDFKIKDGGNTVNLSDYQRLKAAAYDILTSSDTWITLEPKDRDAILNSFELNYKALEPYISAEIWDRLYDIASPKEKIRMDEIIGDNEKAAVQQKSFALFVYSNDVSTATGSRGEVAYATISAPAFTLTDLTNSILFNIYNMRAFNEEFEAAFTTDYSAYYARFVEEAVSRAIDAYRDTIKGVSLSELAERIVEETVMSLVPMYYANSLSTEPTAVIDYEYNRSYGDIERSKFFTTLYDYLYDNAAVFTKEVNDAPYENSSDESKTKWGLLWKIAKDLADAGNPEGIERFNLMKSIPSDLPLTNKYVRYVELLRENAVKEMEAAKDEAELRLSAELVERVLNDTSGTYTYISADARQRFTYIYGASLGGQSIIDAADALLRAQVVDANTDMYIQLVNVAGANANNVIYANMNYASAFGWRLSEVMFYVQQRHSSIKAFDLLYENCESLNINMTKARLDYLLSVLPDASSYNNFLGNDLDPRFIEFKKAKLFLQILNAYRSSRPVLTEWYSESLLVARVASFKMLETICASLPANALGRLHDERDGTDNSYSDRIKMGLRSRAFDIYVDMFVQKGREIASFTLKPIENAEYNAYLDSKAIFDGIKNITLYADVIAALDLDNLAVIDMHKAKAVQYFRDNGGTTEAEKVNIEAEIAFNGLVGAYDALRNRADMGADILFRTEAYYYFAILQDMLALIDADVKSRVDLEDLDAVLANAITSTYGILRQIINGVNTSTASSDAAARKFAYDDYLALQQRNEKTAYTSNYTSLHSLRQAVEENDIYDSVYPTFKTLLDEILDKLYNDAVNSSSFPFEDYGRYTRGYKELVNVIVEDLMKEVYKAIDEVNAERTAANVYDGVLSDLFKVTTAVEFEQAVEIMWRLAYEEAKQKAIDDAYPYLDLDDVFDAGFNAIYEQYILFKSDGNSYGLSVETFVLDLLYRLEGVYDTLIASNPDVILTAIYVQARQEDLLSGLDGAAKLTSLVRTALLLRAYEIESEKIDRHYSIDTERDVTVVIGYKYRRVQALISALTSSQRYSSALAELLDALNNPLRNNYKFAIGENTGDTNYAIYEAAVKERLKLTSLANINVSLADYLDALRDELISGAYDASKPSRPSLQYYRDSSYGVGEAFYLNVLKLISPKLFDKDAPSLRTVYMTFHSEDSLNGDSSDYARTHVLVFDPNALNTGRDGMVLANGYVLVANGQKGFTLENGYHGLNPDAKQENVSFIRNNVDYNFRFLTVEFVDFNNPGVNMGDAIITEGTEVFTTRNKLTIDPLEPYLPTTVSAYAVVRNTQTNKDEALYLGMVQVFYGSEFETNVYDGRTQPYKIYLTDYKNQRYELIIDVTYGIAAIDEVFVVSSSYGKDGENPAVFPDGSNRVLNGLYDTEYGTGKNLLFIDPTNENVLDQAKKKYVLPSEIYVSYKKANPSDRTKTAVLQNVVWDDAALRYALSGQGINPDGTYAGVNIRLLSYEVLDTQNWLMKKVSFNYASSSRSITIVVSTLSGEEVRRSTFKEAPEDKIWNIAVVILDKSIKNLYKVDASGSETLFASLALDGVLEVLPNVHNVNPYDIIYPSLLRLEDKDAGSYDARPSFSLEYGAAGTFKLDDLLKGKPILDRSLVATFTWLGYVIRVRFTAEDMVYENLPDEDPYFDGGIIYLVLDRFQSPKQQLDRFYPYLYYNFSTSDTPNWQKVPLGFSNTHITNSGLNTARVGTYILYGVLGWDAVKNPGLVLSDNIRFTVIVVEPKLYAELLGNINPYVTHDLISVPSTSAFQRPPEANADEPQVYGNPLIWFMYLSESYELIKDFCVEQTAYSILDNKASFTVSYELTSKNLRIAANNPNNVAVDAKRLSFIVTMLLDSYSYTRVTEPIFDKTPVQDDNRRDLWKWKQGTENAIVWPLGQKLNASALPKVYDRNNKEIVFSLRWDLSGVNVNCATETGYEVYGYYFSKDGKWERLTLIIYIEKVNQAQAIREASSSTLSLVKTVAYSGHYYQFPLELTASVLRFLRSDGTFSFLSNASYIIEYRLASGEDGDYRQVPLFTTDPNEFKFYPLNAGKYKIRVSLDDYNMFVDGLVFELEITAVPIARDTVRFRNDNLEAIDYVYDGKGHPLEVVSGLPYVAIENWFNTEEEKISMWEKYTSTGAYNLEAARNLAYLDLRERVTPAAKTYLESEKAKFLAKNLQYVGKGEAVLNAAFFYSLTVEMGVMCEVIYTITYVDQDTGNPLPTGAVPTDVGSYEATFRIPSEPNNGNYFLSGATGTLIRYIRISKLEIQWDKSKLGSLNLQYNGLPQNPIIKGLTDDGTGETPDGVVLTWTYRNAANNALLNTQYVINAGTYFAYVHIDGGKNYSSGDIGSAIDTFTVNVAKRELLIDLDDTKLKSGYLDPLADVASAIKFIGLVGNDAKSTFGTVFATTTAKDYYICGTYFAKILGFKHNATDENFYTDFDDTADDATRYYGERLYLKIKQLGLSGSAYQTLINMFNNYNIYVISNAVYTIEAEADAVVITNNTDLQNKISALKSGEKAVIYLAEGYYGKITLNAMAANVTIIGCYNADKEIISFIEGITVNYGSLELRIIGITVSGHGASAITVGGAASDVYLRDCVLNGSRSEYTFTTGIVTAVNYRNEITLDNVTLTQFYTAVELRAGNLTVTKCEFSFNSTGIKSTPTNNVLSVNQSVFKSHGETAIYTLNTDINKTLILNNRYEFNFVCIEIRQDLVTQQNARNAGRRLQSLN